MTSGIRISVEPQYDPIRSNPADSLWFYLYTVTIRNESSETVQLKSRHWVITDEKNRIEEVRGPGVVGEQPVLAPGERFRYTSGCPLKTATGFMHGSYQMVTQGGEPRQFISWSRKDVSAWCADRPGRKPYEQSRKSCS